MNIKAILFFSCIFLSLFISGCKDNTEQAAGSKRPEKSEFVLDFKQISEPKVFKSELFLRLISIRHDHIELPPTLYHANQISKVVLNYSVSPDVERWYLDSMDIYLKDGSIKSENPVKTWDVNFSLSFGHGGEPVRVEQHFSYKKP